MRLFLTAAAMTIVFGLGAATLLAAEPAQPGESYAAANDVRSPQDGKFVSLDRAFQRLELEALIEEFYADLAQQAQDLSTAERLRLFYDAEKELRAMVLESQTYAGENKAKGEDYLEQARRALAYHLGLDRTPASAPLS